MHRASIIALAAAGAVSLGVSAIAQAAGKPRRKRTFSAIAAGAQRMSDMFTRQAPHTDGIGEISGKGTCTTGSGLHQG